ncbi:MAG: 50S ribosomal protein L9 [Prevotella sp.]|nr:50S ribosomal protein L9 [Prevotella sp.]
MEIILKEDIIGLGYKNDIVNVKAGYGRNYLLPTGKAIMATPSAKKVLAENLRQQARKLAAIKEAADKKAQTLNDVSLVIEMKVSANGVTYGSVNAAMIAAELQKKGFDIDRKIITMHDAKALGDYVAHVHLHKEVTVEIPVKVVAENAAPAPAEEAPKAEEVAVEEAPQAEETVETSEEAEAPVEE